MKCVVDVIPAFSACSASLMRVQVKPWHFALARQVQLSLTVSEAISRSVSQSSSFVESFPSNVEMSRSKDVVRFVCHYVVHKVSVYFYIALFVHMIFHRSGGWM